MASTPSATTLQIAYRRLARFKDLWILLAWGAIIGGMMLNTTFHRNCADYSQNLNPVATCETIWDFLVLFGAGLGAGLVLVDERVGLVGFLGAHLLGTGIFIGLLQAPVGVIGDPVLTDTVVSRALVLALSFEFPFGIVISFIGCMLGVLSKGRLESARIRASL
jgi:hypothetical protein